MSENLLGKNIPEAELIALDEKGPKKVKFSELKGAPALLLFFPLVNTGVCHSEMCSIRDSIQRYNSLKTRVIAVSVDSPFAWKLWAEKEGFKFEFWSDFNKEASNKLGCIYEELVGLKGVSKRSAFIVDAKGIIQYAWISEDSKKLPLFDEIVSVLQKL